MSLKNPSALTLKIALSLAAVSLLANCGTDQQFGALNGSATSKSMSSQAEVAPVVDPNGDLKDGREGKDGKDCNTAPTPTPSPAPTRDPAKDPGQPSQSQTLSCNYPIYPYALKGRSSNLNMGASIKQQPVPGNLEIYQFQIYNASNLTHGWVPLSIGLPLDRYSAPMYVDVPAQGKNGVVLLLSSYEPTIWRVRDPGGRVKRVEIGGTHCQSVEGVSHSLVNDRSAESQATTPQVYQPLSGVLIKSQYVYDGTDIDFMFTAGI